MTRYLSLRPERCGRMRRWLARSLASTGVICSGLMLPGDLAAQRLSDIEALARGGRIEDARSQLMTWYDTQAPSADRNDTQHALWLRGLLTLDPSQAREDYLRLALEFAGGPWSDGALARLALIARAEGDEATAARRYRSLVRDYPSSPERPAAVAWLDDYEAREPAPEPAAPVPAVPATPAPATAAAPARTTPAPATAAPVQPVAALGRFTVQLGAFGQAAGAQALAARVRDRGFDVRIVTVEGSSLLRVRAGRFTSESEAAALQSRLRSAGFEVNLSSDADRERTP
jgi:cell division septation protein DedD